MLSLIISLITKVFRVIRVRSYRSAMLRSFVFASTEHDNVIDGLGLESVVDIGANRGQFALCARRLYPSAVIYSFEPLRKPANVYLKIFKGDPRSHLFNKAIGSSSGSDVMHVTRWDVSSSLLPIAQGQRDNFPFAAEARRETVTRIRLSECLDKNALAGTALLKLDVQGYELEALRGCEDLLDRFKYVYVESSFIELYAGQALAADVIAYLIEKGFRLICVANLSNGKSKRPIQADFLFGAAPSN
jgi:FkbM family methyltransferase